MTSRQLNTRISDDDRAVFRRVSRTLQAPRGTAPPPLAPLPPPLPTIVAPVVLAIAPDASWDEVLDQCVRQLGAIAAFIIDDRGLLVAGSGAMPLGMLEGTGARLVIAIHQADHMESAAGSARGITVEFDGQWLTGIRLPTETTYLTVGLFTDRPLDASTRAAVAQAFATLRTGPS
ncbi:MAG: hypothetical protein K8W52_04775 [Deltaproteobacteria bacterium]|nr:hypothetical protein [Deltaproteobacteria bacterium]